MKVKKKKTWLCEVAESENQIMIFRKADDLLWHIKNNGPVTCGTIELDKRDAVRVEKELKSNGVCAVGVRWNKYCESFGYKKV